MKAAFGKCFGWCAIGCTVGSIDYAIYGDMAMVLHGFNQGTDRIDILTTAEGAERAGHEFGAGRPGVHLAFIAAGDAVTRDGRRFPEPHDVAVVIDGFSVVALSALIELKLASGLTIEHRRYRDLADVQRLIIALNLPRQFGDRLGASVREEYYRLWTSRKLPIPTSRAPKPRDPRSA